ncbi:FAD/NAD(P)-binding domain-containing protein [Exidia glandulosa HHB12029]|uniref:FAD/NAD(P)-binding domain-containing protein n=1 Tax=Exidia glandulosa HHB12029 TaxID=1314781 RepID=A0A165EVU0_EXIGL|nr:FAD/NAD(P)-binding domain-containing protein [Exidia glandulosa HHB12029]
MTAVSTELRIAIIGGGISGLCLASVLEQYDVAKKLEIHVYEAAASFGEVGAGVTIWGRSFQVLRALGLEAKFAAIDMNKGREDEKFGFKYRRSDQGPNGHEYGIRPFPNGHAYHRAQFLSVLSDHVEQSPRIIVSFNKRLESVDTQNSLGNDPYTLRFKDGTTSTCDVLIGADGIRSPVRIAMLDVAVQETGDATLKAAGPAVWCGTSIYRTLVPMAEVCENYLQLGGNGTPLIKDGPIIYSGKGKALAVYPIQGGTVANIAINIMEGKQVGEPYPHGSWVSDVDPAFLKNEFEGWEIEVGALMKGVKKSSRWGVHVVLGLKSFAYGRIAVQGDAAHAMTPYNGSGANQAIEDAFVLGRMLAHPLCTRETVHHALKAYDSVRRERAQAIQELSFELGRLGTMTEPFDESADVEAATSARLLSVGAWVGQGDMEEEVQKAEVNFKALVNAV